MKSLAFDGVFKGIVALALVGFGPLSAAASAQVFSSQRAQNTPAELTQTGATLRTMLEQDETLYLNKNKTYDYDLVLRTDSAIGNQRLPVGTVIRGRFEPADGGLVYVANSVEVADRIYQINAASDLIRDRKDPRQTSTGAILTDAAIGAAGGYVLGEVLGRPDLWEVAGGAAAGVLVGNTTAPFVVVISPEDSIVLHSN